MSIFAFVAFAVAQSGGAFEDAPRAPDRRVTSYDITCEGNRSTLSFAEDFRRSQGPTPIIRTVSLLKLGGANATSIGRSFLAAFSKMALVKSVVTSCKGNSAFFIVEYVSQDVFREALRKDLRVSEQAPVERLLLTMSPTGAVTSEPALTSS